ncbi:MAG: hypothetical protein Q4C56_04055 [Peptococcaceae bacterium]|nr:hypothetical protein [Peptococcaceae bacterium]
MDKETTTAPQPAAEQKKPAPTVTAAAKSTAKESVYDAAYLAKNHKALGASYAIVAASLRLAGKDKATLAEAKKIVTAFKTKEVK